MSACRNDDFVEECTVTVFASLLKATFPQWKALHRYMCWRTSIIEKCSGERERKHRLRHSNSRMEKEKMDLNFTKQTVASVKTTVEELEKKEMEEQ